MKKIDLILSIPPYPNPRFVNLIDPTAARHHEGQLCPTARRYWQAATAAWLWLLLVAVNATGQITGGRVELGNDLGVDEPEQTARTMLERAKATAAEKQWEDAIDAILAVQEQYGDKLTRCAEERWLPVHEQCQRLLAALPAEGLAVYRARVDAAAKRLYDQGTTRRDPSKLRAIVDDYFASGWTDRALLALGDLEIGAGRPARAREAWERIHPELRGAEANPPWLTWRAAAKSSSEKSSETKSDRTAAPLCCPQTELPLADLRARLITASIAERHWERAEWELKQFAADFPDSPGSLGGKRGLWRELLTKYLRAERSADEAIATAATIEHQQQLFRESTFAGNAARNFNASQRLTPRRLAWEKPIPFGSRWQCDVTVARSLFLPERRTAEDSLGLLSVAPLVAEPWLLWCDEYRIYAFDLRTGKPAWGSPQRRPGEIYAASAILEIDKLIVERGGRVDGGTRNYRALGAPRFTLTVQGDLLLARIGWPVTYPANGQATEPLSQLVCLNLAKQGFEVWSAQPPGERWSFEGTPVCDEDFAYSVLRYHDVRPQLHVFCYELATGQVRWRRMVCSGEALARGQIDEISHALLTLGEGRLFLNTSLGGVAALDAASGRIEWIAQYPRAATLSNARHAFRDLTPPVFDRGTIYVAPCDTPEILALDTASGRIRWRCRHADDAVHLLGAAAGNLIASGKKLWWIDAETGRVNADYPDVDANNAGTAGGFGRGVIAGDLIYWPRRGDIAVLHTALRRETPGFTLIAQPPIAFAPLATELTGGHLAAVGGNLVITGPERIWCLGPRGKGEPPAAAVRTSLEGKYPLRE